MLEQRMIESGMSPDDARALARRQLGNTTLIKEQTLDAWRYTFVDTLIGDFRYAVRTLIKNFSFAATAVLTLALGIGATTAIFSVVYSVLIKPLPYPNADELVRIRHSARGELGGADFDPTMYFTYRDENRTFASIGLWQDGSATLTDRGEPERVRTLRVTDGTLPALGVQPMRGRWFTEHEHGPAAGGYVFHSHSRTAWIEARTIKRAGQRDRDRQRAETFGKLILQHTGVMDNLAANYSKHGTDPFELFIRYGQVVVAENRQVRQSSGFDRAQPVFHAQEPAVFPGVKPERVLTADLLAIIDKLA
jgi:hypothetical protein